MVQLVGLLKRSGPSLAVDSFGAGSVELGTIRGPYQGKSLFGGVGGFLRNFDFLYFGRVFNFIHNEISVAPHCRQVLEHGVDRGVAYGTAVGASNEMLNFLRL